MPLSSSSGPTPDDPHPLPRTLQADDDVRGALLAVHTTLIVTLARLDGLIDAADARG